MKLCGSTSQQPIIYPLSENFICLSSSPSQPLSVSPFIPLSLIMPSIRCGWEELTIDQPGSISANKHVRREEKRARNRLRERERERGGGWVRKWQRKSQFDPIRLLGVWRCKWDDWPVIAGLMLGNQSPSGLDINKHPSNCPFFFLIPPPLPGPAWTLTNNTTTMRAKQWCLLKKKTPGGMNW